MCLVSLTYNSGATPESVAFSKPGTFSFINLATYSASLTHFSSYS